MNKKAVSVLVLISAIMFLSLSQAMMTEAKPKPRATGGVFDNADFFTPDYSNGGSETFDVGENRTFNYDCHCASGPGSKNCNGYIILQVDTGSGFTNEKSDSCNINTGQACSASHVKTFNTADTYTFRVFCDENVGTDFTQPSNEHVVLTVESSGCTENETQPCPLQEGVCEGVNQTCVNGSWTECDYGSNYEEPESTCDELDNDCDGLTDNVDGDGDLSSPCGGMGVVNELLISGLDNNDGQIEIFAYSPSISSYESLWSNDNVEITNGRSGGEIGDVTHDGKNDFVISTHDGTYSYLEVWTYSSSLGEWYMVSRDITVTDTSPRTYIGDIGDFDNDGKNEILITDQEDYNVEIWGNDTVNATGFSLDTTIRNCDSNGYVEAGGDLNGNNIPEIVLQCGSGGDVEIYEWNGTDYDWQDSVAAPFTIDDMECGDLDRDSDDECVFCGNSGRSHVLDYSSGSYSIAYTSPQAPTGYTQTCAIGDITNDGWPDWFDGSRDGIRVFSYSGSEYYSVWNSSALGSYDPGIASSFAGDADNDGKGEFLIRDVNSDKIMMWESDTVGATSFENTFNWNDADSSSNVIIGNLNPYNDDLGEDCNDSDDSIYPGAPEICGDGIDQDCSGSDLACNCIDSDNDTYYAYDGVYCPTGDDCNDSNSSINPGASEVCDGVDNDCDDEIDEGCSSCGDSYCAGSALGEDCFTCPDDCLCSGPNCKHACCGDGTCDGPFEDAGNCPVDCS